MELKEDMKFQVKGAWSIPDGDLALNYDMNTANVEISNVEYFQGNSKMTLEDYYREIFAAAGGEGLDESNL